MLKLFGALFIFIAIILVGTNEYTATCERKHTLKSILSSLRLMEGVLRYQCPPLEDCFRKSGGIFLNASKFIEKGLSPCDALKKTISEERFLLNEDKSALYRFANGLYIEDCDGQIANLKALSKEMALLCEDATESVKTKGKLYLRGSVLIGAAFFILLI